MKSYRKTAVLTGILFLIAMAASLVGGAVLESPQGKSNEFILTIGVTLEIVNALSVLGIGMLVFSVLNIYQNWAANAYLGLRILESIACLAAPLIVVLLIEHNDLRSLFTGRLIPLFFCCGALVFYTFLYKTKLLPRYIAVWGFIGVVGIVALNLISFENSFAMVLALPIILNEIFMGIWLIVKGFHPQKLYTNHNKRS